MFYPAPKSISLQAEWNPWHRLLNTSPSHIFTQHQIKIIHSKLYSLEKSQLNPIRTPTKSRKPENLKHIKLKRLKNHCNNQLKLSPHLTPVKAQATIKSLNTSSFDETNSYKFNTKLFKEALRKKLISMSLDFSDPDDLFFIKKKPRSPNKPIVTNIDTTKCEIIGRKQSITLKSFYNRKIKLIEKSHLRKPPKHKEACVNTSRADSRQQLPPLSSINNSLVLPKPYNYL